MTARSESLTLSPSLMCADFQNLRDEVERLDEAGSDQYHLDIMDGVFVPNYAMGLHDVEAIRAVTKTKLDCHLMVANPDLAVSTFADAGVDIMHVHIESTPHIGRLLTAMKDRGVEAGVALSPGTAVETIVPVIDVLDHILVMTVNPGFAAQKYLAWVDRKIAQIVELRGDRDISIGVDGAISPERVHTLSEQGVNNFILGTSSLFGRGDYRQSLETLRK